MQTLFKPDRMLERSGQCIVRAVWTFLALFLIFAGCALVNVTIAGSVFAFGLAFAAGGKAYSARNDLETFWGCCLLLILGVWTIRGSLALLDMLR